VDAARVLHVGNNVTLHLVPAPVVAKVCTSPVPHAPASHAAELELAEHLLHRGVPVAPPSRALPPGPHPCGPCCVATFWEFVEGEPAGALAPEATGPLLRDLHAALADYRPTIALQPWTRALDAAGANVVDPAAVAPLPASDRKLLHDLYVELRAQIDGAAVRLRPIHGDARPGNLLQTGTGLRWMDFEAVCLGPAEWDAASMPAGTEAWLPDLDAALLGVLRRMRQVCLVIWCWNQYARTTEIARAAEFHLARLKDATRTPTGAGRDA
jgi:Ser/Thr protein kinase RdoA (MazF antagonist)